MGGGGGCHKARDCAALQSQILLPEKVAHRACLSAADRGLFVVHMPSCLHPLLCVARPLHRDRGRGRGDCHLGCVPSGFKGGSGPGGWGVGGQQVTPACSQHSRHTGSPANSTGLSVGLATERSWDRSPDRACLEAGGGSRASRASFLGKSPN